MKENNRIVLSFDLDNTIINNREGIVNSFNYALNKYKIPERDPLLIERMIGTPLHEMFTKITDFNPIMLVSAFREFYSRKGIYQVTLLPGIKSKLKELNYGGLYLFLPCNCKNLEYIGLVKGFIVWYF